MIGRGWVEGAELRVGDRVPSAEGGPGSVEAISWSRGPATMYDLTVAISHTFFVGDGGWLVHNRGPECGHLKEADEAYPK